jgi:hypothetical protein
MGVSVGVGVNQLRKSTNAAGERAKVHRRRSPRRKLNPKRIRSFVNEVFGASMQATLRRSPRTDHFCSPEADQARNTDGDRDVQPRAAGRQVARWRRCSSLREPLS